MWCAARSLSKPCRVLLGDASAPQEVAGGIRAVDLEAIVLATVLASETHVMKHRSRVEQFRIEPQPLTFARQGAPMVNAARMVKEKRGFRVPHQFGYFTSNLAVGDRNLVYCGHHWVFSSRSWGDDLVMLIVRPPLNDGFVKRNVFNGQVGRKSLIPFGKTS